MHRFLTLFIILAMFLIGCGDSTSTALTFRGESEHWKAECTQRATETWSKDSTGKLQYKSSGARKLTLFYKGTDPSKIGHIKFKYDTGLGGGSGDAFFNENGSLILDSVSGENIGILDNDHIIIVSVDWNGIKEVIRLTSK